MTPNELTYLPVPKRSAETGKDYFPLRHWQKHFVNAPVLQPGKLGDKDNSWQLLNKPGCGHYRRPVSQRSK
jgi:hypothetical protein